MRRLLALIRKESYQILLDPAALLITFALPPILLFPFAFAVSLGEFGATSFLARPDRPTIPVAMFQQNDGSFNVAWRRSKPKASLDGFGSESEGALPPLTATGDEPASDRGVDTGASSGDGTPRK